ncbi:MAG: hypothetical protein HY020_11570 [Burkholderiales bacterium]|nr:hypothetical protein [Burkholderiales bacterium]
MPANLAIHRLSARTPARAQPVAARLALQALGADLEDALPRSLPPQALLWLRRLQLQAPEAALLRPAPAAWRQDWIAMGRERLDSALAQAVRPALGPVPESAPAVLFADASEMLACLALAAQAGQLDRWWWRGVLGRAWPQWQVAWAARPEAQAGAERLLARLEQGAAVASWLPAPPAPQDRLMPAPVVEGRVIETGPGQTEPSQPAPSAIAAAGIQPEVAAQASGSQVPRASVHARAVPLARADEAITLPRPGAASAGLLPQAAASAEATTRDDEAPRLLPPAPRRADYMAPASAAGRPTLRKPASPPQALPPQGSGSAAPHTHAAPVPWAETPVGTRLHTTEPASIVPTGPVVPRPEITAAAGEMPVPSNPPVERHAPPAAKPARSPHRVAVKAPQPSPAPELVGEAAPVWPWPEALLTRHAPLLFVVNALLEDGLFPDFTRPRDPGLPVPLWALLAALAQAWRLPADDPLLLVLAERSPDWTTPEVMPATPGVAAAAWPEWLTACARSLRRRLCRRLGRRTAAWPRTLTLARPARLWLSEAEWVVEYDLTAHDVAWRLAGLDRDPGWLPSAGCGLRFVFTT